MMNDNQNNESKLWIQFLKANKNRYEHIDLSDESNIATYLDSFECWLRANNYIPNMINTFPMYVLDIMDDELQIMAIITECMNRLNDAEKALNILNYICNKYTL